jgi:hypothetical protein
MLTLGNEVYFMEVSRQKSNILATCPIHPATPNIRRSGRERIRPLKPWERIENRVDADGEIYT